MGMVTAMRVMVVLALTAVWCVASAASETARDAIAQLDRALGKRLYYIDKRQHLIDSLKDQYGYGVSADGLIAIGDAYRFFENDSAIHYYELASSLADGSPVGDVAKLKYSSLMPLSGLHEVAHSVYESLDTCAYDDMMSLFYHTAGRQLYSYLASAYADYEPYGAACRRITLDHQGAMLERLDKDSEEYLFNLGEYYFMSGDSVRAEALLGRLVGQSDDLRHLARANHHLSALARGRGDDDGYLRYLAASAIADIESATLEVSSLQELGDALYEAGDVERAYRYLTTALDNAVRCGARLRMVQSARSMPLIAQAHYKEIASWRTWIYAIMAALALLLVGLAFSLVVLRRKMTRLASVEQTLRRAVGLKDEYIGRFLQLCSIYMDKLNTFCKIAERKISAGKADEFLRMVKSGKFVEEQNRDFYAMFDDAFLNLYPRFVSEVNGLLKPECRITPGEGERMNTDLRILAIKRMGIDDAASIAQILNYSLNTIYAYRNRLKARAINRETFEDDVMKIGQ